MSNEIIPKIPKIPKILVGSSSFNKLVLNSDLFVDKSLFIKEVIENSADVLLITRPRRWGKSINMDMIKCFLEIEVDIYGNRLEVTDCRNRRLFFGGDVDLDFGEKKNIKPLKVATTSSNIINRQGQFPVIYINFKEIKGANYEEILSGVMEQVINLFIDHRYLKKYLEHDDETLDIVIKNRLKRFYAGIPTIEDVKVSLKFMTELLFMHFGQKSYVLIDEYDTPINFAYLKFGDTKEFQLVTDLFSGILSSGLKDNQFLEKGLITGILRIAKANLFSGLNNIREYSLLDKNFSNFYGFTQDEVDELLTNMPYLNLSESIKKWYNGYTFGNEIVYNPWSVMCCLSNNGKFETYWIDSGGTGLIDKTFLSDNIQADLQKLVSGEDIVLPISKYINFSSIEKPNGLYSLLLFSGYLNAHVVDLYENIYSLSIPNMEVYHIYKERLLQWVYRQLNAQDNEFYSFVCLLTTGKIDEFRDQFQEFLQSATSMHQVGKKRAELFYNGFMLGLTSILSSNFILDSERESGIGRPDLVLISKPNKGNNAIIIEYKVVNTESELLAAAQDGLDQINAKNYDTKIRKQIHIKKILKISMAFCNKEMAMEYEVVNI